MKGIEKFANYRSHFGPSGLFGGFGTLKYRRNWNSVSYVDDTDKQVKRTFDNEDERRDAEALAAEQFRQRLERLVNRSEEPKRRTPKSKAPLQVNEKDTFDSQIDALRDEEKHEIAELKKAGMLDQKGQSVDDMLNGPVKEGGDKAARNMLTAYSLMGAGRQDLLNFRLALIAYMVPVGKKTVLQVVEESHEAGVKGAEQLETQKEGQQQQLEMQTQHQAQLVVLSISSGSMREQLQQQQQEMLRQQQVEKQDLSILSGSTQEQ